MLPIAFSLVTSEHIFPGRGRASVQVIRRGCSSELQCRQDRGRCRSDQQQDPGKGFMSRLSKLDRYVIKRHSEIYPSEDHLNGVLKLVSNVEEVMKAVSQEWNKDEENDIKIEGMVSFYLDFDLLLHAIRFIDIDFLQVRVGDLSKGLLLAPDRSVSLVLLCISEPSKTMLKQIHVSMRAKMKELHH